MESQPISVPVSKLGTCLIPMTDSSIGLLWTAKELLVAQKCLSFPLLLEKRIIYRH